MKAAQKEFDFDAPPRPEPPRREASAAMLERIKKLLRLAADRRGNVHEAERAMQLAFELAEKFRVDVEALDLDEGSARVVHEYFAVGGRYDRLRRGVFGILRSYFHVTTCLCGERMLVVGRAQDVTIARYVHDFLLRAGRRCLADYLAMEKAARRAATAAKRANYLAGFIYGVSAALDGARKSMPLSDSQSALVVAEEHERDQVLNELVPERRTLTALPDSRKNRSALYAGWDAGRATQIHQPLADAPGAPLQLT